MKRNGINFCDYNSGFNKKLSLQSLVESNSKCKVKLDSEKTA